MNNNKKERKNLYNNKEWKNFSKKMKEELGNYCFKCGRHEKIILQVHHIVYEKGKKPWESQKEDLELLCKGCHAREHDILEPSDSWFLLDITDNMFPDFQCERQISINETCNTQIRYEHTIYHPKVGYRIVGSTCIKHLTAEDQKISKDVIKEENSFQTKLQKLTNNKDLIKNWKLKEIIKKDSKNTSLTIFKINKTTNNGTYNIKSTIYNNDNGINNMTLQVNNKEYSFTDKNKDKKSKYIYGSDIDLKKIILIVEGIKRSENQKKELILDFYKDKLKNILNELKYKMKKED